MSAQKMKENHIFKDIMYTFLKNNFVIPLRTKLVSLLLFCYKIKIYL